MTRREGSGTPRGRWVWGIGIGVAAFLAGYCAWLVITDAPAWRFLVRLYVELYYFRNRIMRWFREQGGRRDGASHRFAVVRYRTR